MTQIIAVSKAGKNVLEITNPNDFIFHSGYNSLKIISEGLWNINVPAGADEIYSFAHGLSYIPLVEGFCKVDVINVAVCPYEGMGSFPFLYFFYYIGSDANNIYVKLYNGDSSAHTFSIKYYIFEVPF